MTARKDKLVLHFNEFDKSDVELVGGKSANLGEMTKAGFPVPGGFAVTVAAYDLLLSENKLDEQIYQILNKIDTSKPQELQDASLKVRKMVLNAKIQEDISKKVIAYYKNLSGKFKKAYVAVRSSATAEDLAGASFAGQQETFLNIIGESNVMEKVKECWASLFTARSIFYRVTNKITHEKVKISVIVQKMVQSDVSGVMFSMDPVTNDKDKIIIESVWGLGEMIVQGSVVPDKYVVQKETFDILSKEVSDQSVQLIKKGAKTKKVEVPKKIINKQKLENKEIIELAKYAQKLQEHYYFPQDIEWAKEKGKLYIIQTRPVTTIKKGQAVKTLIEKEKGVFKIADSPILTGAPASPGIGIGVVKILKSPKEIDKIKTGDILVATMTSPDYVPAMKKASAIITDQGGQTSHAAIVSRELGIPCVVGTKEATTKLEEGSILTVDGKTGNIYLGSKVSKKEARKEGIKEKKYSKVRTATRVYVNLAEPELAKKISKLHVDGVGLLRAEFMIANIGVHPKEAIKRKEQGKFVDILTSDLETFCKSFYPKPVVYRATDFKTNEYRSLSGGKYWEPEEPNPLLGYRGAFRYVNDPEVFNLELSALLNVRKKYDNLHLMIPFVRSPEELAKVRRLVATEGFFEKSSFKFWMMVELPVNIILLEDFIKVGIDGVSIGSNDLTMLLEGVDRDNSEVASAFNERSPAVSWALKRIIRICNKNKVTSSICGQAPSQYDDLVEDLVRWGVTSISVNPDSVDRVRGVISKAEAKIVNG
ncbi:phosphoenolpyruvate synthase [Patescibacteria group bacterium]